MPRPSPRPKKWSGGRHDRVANAREGASPSRTGGSGDFPRENFDKLVPLNAFCVRFGVGVSIVFVNKNDRNS